MTEADDEAGAAPTDDEAVLLRGARVLQAGAAAAERRRVVVRARRWRERGSAPESHVSGAREFVFECASEAEAAAWRRDIAAEVARLPPLPSAPGKAQPRGRRPPLPPQDEPEDVTRVRRVLSAVYWPGASGFSDCLTAEDRAEADRSGSSLLYGEVLPSGVHRMMDDDHLRAGSAAVLFDLGAGLGKLAVQCFLQYPNLRRVVGVELAWTRFGMARDAALCLSRVSCEAEEKERGDSGAPAPRLLEVTADGPAADGSGADAAVRLVESAERGEGDESKDGGDTRRRVLELRRGNLFDVPDVEEADVVVLETLIPEPAFPRLAALLARLRPGCRVLTFANLASPEFAAVYERPAEQFPLRQLPANVPQSDRFATTWNRRRGHHFHLYERVALPQPTPGPDPDPGPEPAPPVAKSM